jgi:hypothetical protein
MRAFIASIDSGSDLGMFTSDEGGKRIGGGDQDDDDNIVQLDDHVKSDFDERDQEGGVVMHMAGEFVIAVVGSGYQDEGN